MALSETVYKMIEDVVGSEYVTENPAMLSAYRRGMFPTEAPAAVVMPKRTEEVQALVKICNRYKIRYSCFVTMGASCPEPGMILFDLKRMDKLIEINEKDMYAIVEPAVTKSALAIESFKRGLQYNNPGAAGSVVAGALGGDGYKDYRYGGTTHNLLGFEWVLPTGDIMRTGSLGTGAGWFCPTGPGPSLDGLLSKGSMGIVTKVAIQLYPWPGPRVLQVEGATPNYKIMLPEDRFKLIFFKMPSIEELGDAPSLEKLGDALREIGKAEVGVCAFKAFNFAWVMEGSSTMEEAWEKYTSGFFQRETSRQINVWLQAWSREDLEYQEKVVREIVAEMGGEEAQKEVYETMTEPVLGGMTGCCLTSCRAQRTSGFSSTFGSLDSIDMAVEWGKGLPELRKEFMEKGLIMEATDSFRIMPMEYGHTAFTENLILGDPTIPESREAMMAYGQKSMERNFREKFPGVPMLANEETKERIGPLHGNFHLWQKKIKKALDPNLVSNPKGYIIPE